MLYHVRCKYSPVPEYAQCKKISPLLCVLMTTLQCVVQSPVTHPVTRSTILFEVSNTKPCNVSLTFSALWLRGLYQHIILGCRMR